MMPQVIGFSGKKRSGKDTAANWVVKHYGYIKIGFADVLREAVWELNPIVGNDPLTGDLVRYRDAVEALGYEKAKDFYPEFRRVLEAMGTDVGREVLGANIWVDRAVARLDPTLNYVFSDVRFPNEVEAVESTGGVVIRIERESLAQSSHLSDTALDNHPFKYVIQNNRSIGELEDRVTAILSEVS